MRTTFLHIALLAATVPGPAALAEKTSGFAAIEGVATSSPFEYARSGAKAARVSETQAAWAKVIGGEVAADGAWPWQVAPLVGGGRSEPTRSSAVDPWSWTNGC